WMKWTVGAAVAVGLMWAWSGTRSIAADDATTTGTVNGTVVDPDGKPVADAKVHLMIPPPKHTGDKKKELKKDAAEAGDKGGDKAPGDKLEKPKPVAEATTDAK